MPPKRKTLAKKKKGKKKQGGGAANNETLPYEIVDSLEKYQALRLAFSRPTSNWIWIEKAGRLIDTLAKFAKKLPSSVTASLRDGSLSPESAVDESIISKLTYMSAEDDSTCVCQGTKYFYLDVWCLIITNATIPSQEECLALGFEFFRDLKSRMVPKQPKNDQYGRGAIMQAFHETVHDGGWNVRLDSALYSGQVGAFKEHCKLCSASETVFGNLISGRIISLARGGIDGIRQMYTNFAKSIAEDAHLEKDKECWECGAVVPTRLVCSRCKAALYCGRDCQQKAWNDGHKRTCKTLKTKYQVLMEQAAVIDHAHGTNGKKPDSGLKLSYMGDLHVLHALVNRVPSELTFTMDAFYENLERIHNKEWWIYASGGTPTLDQYNEECRRLGKSHKDEENHFFNLLFFVFLDVTESVSASGIPREHFDLSRAAKRSIEDFGIAMPPERFLELYHDDEDPDFDGSERTKTLLRRGSHEYMLQQFRESLHKA